MSKETPDISAILDDLYIGNLASAKTLRDHPELGITHILSVCPDYPEAPSTASAAPLASDSQPTVDQPRHRCIPIQDSEYEDILIHLPSAVAFIKDALETSCAGFVGAKEDGGKGRDASPVLKAQEGLSVNAMRTQKNRVLVHCVMGISRSATVVCAYLMATRRLSFGTALMFIRRRRPLAHPNYGFRRQLAIFSECGYFENYQAPIRSHPAHVAWMRKRKREVGRYLTRVGDVVEVKLDNEDTTLSITDDFPTDATEAACLLSEVETTHLLTISPASMPLLPPSPSPAASAILKAERRPSMFTCPPISSASSSSTIFSSPPDSTFSSPLSSRSSSFSSASHLASPISGPSTAATSVSSLPSLLPPSKLRLEASLDDSDDDVCVDPTFLSLAGVTHYHLETPRSSPADLLVRFKEGACFIQRAFEEDRDFYCDSGSPSCSDSDCELRSASEGHSTKIRKITGQRKHVLIHCTTESRACTIVCAYLMTSRGLTPSQAYNILEEALPLFNPTKSFLTQLELFHACAYNPTPEHPLVRAWLTAGAKPALPASSASGSAHAHPRRPGSAHWKSDSDAEGDSDGLALRRKLGTPARCGSFTSSGSSSNDGSASAYANASATASLSVDSSAAGRQTSAGVDVEALLQHCEGVGDPTFAFDVEAFRGALRGIAAGEKEGGRG